MKNRIVSLLLKCYPRRWRLEYGSEMEDLLSVDQLSISRMFDVLVGAFRERVRHPQTRFIVCSGLIFIALFTAAVLCSPVVWRVAAAPVAELLRNQDIHPPMLVATLPWEQALVIWLGIPLLVTLFATYPIAMALACRGVVTSRADKVTAVSSATLYPAGFTAGLVAWHYGSFGWLTDLLKESGNTRPVSVSECFGLLAASTLGTALVLQLPLVLQRWSSKPGSLEPK